MTRLTRWVLRHKLIVVVFWLLVSVAVAITLLPVILATAGARLDWPRLRKAMTTLTADGFPAASSPRSRCWSAATPTPRPGWPMFATPAPLPAATPA